MRPLMLIVPGRVQSVIQPEALKVLGRLGVDGDWMLYWVLYNWAHMRHGPDSSRYEMIQDLFETLMEADEDEDSLDTLVTDLQISLDLLTLNAQNVYNQLRPFIGDLCEGTDRWEITGFEHRPFARGDTLIKLDIEPTE